MYKKINFLTMISIIVNVIMLIPMIILVLKVTGEYFSTINWSILFFFNIIIFIFIFSIGVVQLMIYDYYKYGLFLWNGLVNIIPFLSIVSIFVSLLIFFNLRKIDLINDYNKKNNDDLEILE